MTRNPAGGWKVKGAGSKRASSTHKTQKAAQKAATKLAKGHTKGQVVIHGRDGKIRTEHTYGCDPNPPSGCSARAARDIQSGGGRPERE